jgi:hypothetical protein
MKRFYALVAMLLWSAAGSGYGSLASSYNADVAKFGGQQVDGGWIRVPCGNGTNLLYKIYGGTVSAVLAYPPPGAYFPENLVWPMLGLCTDKPGQTWLHYNNDAFGNPEWSTNDGRLYAKTFWMGGFHVLRICYAQYLSGNGLMHFPHGKTAHAKPKAKPRHRELLPPVEEAED